MSTGAAEVAPCASKSVSSWNDMSNDQKYGPYDNSAPNDFTAVQEAFETTCWHTSYFTPYLDPLPGPVTELLLNPLKLHTF